MMTNYPMAPRQIETSIQTVVSVATISEQVVRALSEAPAIGLDRPLWDYLRMRAGAAQAEEFMVGHAGARARLKVGHGRSVTVQRERARRKRARARKTQVGRKGDRE